MYFHESLYVHLGLSPVVGVEPIELALHVSQLGIDSSVVAVTLPQ